MTNGNWVSLHMVFCESIFLSAWCMVIITEYLIVMGGDHPLSVELEMCLYVNFLAPG